MKRGSVFRVPHIQEVYPMPYSTFCISHIETWDLGSFGMSETMLKICKSVIIEILLRVCKNGR